MFFLPIIAAVVAAPRVMNLTSRVLEEYFIPRKAGVKGLEAIDRGEEIWAEGLDLAITDGEKRQLEQMGARAILKAAEDRHNILTRAGQTDLCQHCKRLQS